MRPKLQLQKYRAVLRMQVGPKCPFTMSVWPRKRRTLAVGREGRALHARTGTRRKRRSFAAFRARARRRRWRDSVGEQRRQRPGAVASSNLSKALTIPSLSLSVSRPPSSTVCYRRPPAKGRVGRVSFHPRRQGQLSTYARAEEIDGQERHRLSRGMVQLVRVLHFT